MTDYIDRNKAINALEYNNKVFHYADSDKENIVLETVDKLCQVLCEMPAADVQPVKRGIWNTHDVVKVLCSGKTLDGFCQCTACGDVFPLHYSEYNYCPNCGARMDGDTE